MKLATHFYGENYAAWDYSFFQCEKNNILSHLFSF